MVTANANQLIELRNVWYSYSKKQTPDSFVLEDVSFLAHHGERISISGPSGCGKTTFGLICCGLLHPIRGSVAVYSNRNKTNRASPVQMVFQDPFASINPRRRIAEWLSLAIAPYQNKRDGKRMALGEVMKVLEMVGLPSSVLHRYSGQLSGGELQRISIAAALLTSPRCLILDEPVSMLDQDATDLVFTTVRRLISDMEISIVLISHETRGSGIEFDESYAIEDRQLSRTTDKPSSPGAGP
ncbi:MAG: ATP-binding cassette domain-containing protein [Planctomycetota bacterium]|nr:ATP-binding cassette domain-containing protein [Planctomycetota bacterium]